MRLQPKYFDEIKIGRKVIEIRLNDEKRSGMKKGDSINFFLTNDPSKKLNTKVVSVKRYRSVEALILSYELHLFGNVWKNTKDAIDAIDFYSKKDIGKYGLLAIEIKIDDY